MGFLSPARRREQAISGRPAGCALAQAATAAGADAEVPGTLNVAMPGGKLLVPAIVVVAAGAVGEMATRIACDAVLAVVEVVSRSTVSTDRAVKPVMYAGSGHPRVLAGGAAGHAEGRRLLAEPRPVCHRDHAGGRTRRAAASPGPSRSGWTQLTSPAAPPESGRTKPGGAGAAPADGVSSPLMLQWWAGTLSGPFRISACPPGVLRSTIMAAACRADAGVVGGDDDGRPAPCAVRRPRRRRARRGRRSGRRRRAMPR